VKQRETTPSLPGTMKYNKKTKELLVEFTNGSQIKYFDIPPTSIFLFNGNPRKEADFMIYVERFEPKFEIIRKPTKQSGVAQQLGKHKS
jgi:hypothetical protein